MKRKGILACFFIILLIALAAQVFGQAGFFLGAQGGYSAQKPSFKDLEFNTSSSFLYGARLGVKFLMIAVELNFFQAAHSLDPQEIFPSAWEGRRVDYNYLGLNGKYFFPVLLLHPYLTFGYGYYTASIKDIDKDTEKGFNFGLGVELHLGGKFSLLAEGKYHRAKLEIEEKELKLGDFTLSGGFNIYF